MSTNKKPPKPDQEIHEKQKRRMQYKVIAVLAFVSMLYFFIVVPDKLFSTVLGRFDLLLNLGARVVGAGGFTSVAAFILFTTDSAVRGGNRTAKWFQSLYPSVAARQKYGCAGSEAQELWFKYFDIWPLLGSPHNRLLKNNYAATYGARMIFYLQRVCILFLGLAIATILLNCLMFSVYIDDLGDARFVAHVALCVGFFCGWLLLYWTNRPGLDGCEPTGCWQRVEDILGREKAAFQREVLDCSATIAEGHAVIIRLKSSWGLPPLHDKVPEQTETNPN